jgi:uncharacterized protein
LLFGPRGTGKTALAREVFASRKQAGDGYFDLLNSTIYRRYLDNPHNFAIDVEHLLLEQLQVGQTIKCCLVVVDEVQKVPAVLDEVHALIEKHKHRVQFLLTGSSARKLKRSGANLLAGRAISKRLYPLSQLELSLNLDRALQYGTLPAMYLEHKVPVEHLSAYVETYLKEEVLQEALVRNIEGFSRFLDLAGQFNGEPVNRERIAKAARVSSKTVQQYFEILCDTLIAHHIPVWSYSVKAQLAQASKYYLFDTGVLKVIRGEIRTALKQSSFRYGKLFETFVINELVRCNEYLDGGFRFFHWRTSSGSEIDIIMSRGVADLPIAIEIKSDTSPALADVSALLKFREDHPEAYLVCICRCTKPYTLEGGITVLPWEMGIKRVFTLGADE